MKTVSLGPPGLSPSDTHECCSPNLQVKEPGSFYLPNKEHARASLGTLLGDMLEKAVLSLVESRFAFESWLDLRIPSRARRKVFETVSKVYFPSKNLYSSIKGLARLRTSTNSCDTFCLFCLTKAAKGVFDAARFLEASAGLSGTISPGATNKNQFESCCAEGDVVYCAFTPFGQVVVGGPGTTYYNCHNPLLLLDLGGNDIYNQGSNVSDPQAKPQVSLILDLGGNDTYIGQGLPGPGGACFGISLLIDEDGDDLYLGNGVSEGAAIFGLGMLVDRNGNDYYAANFMSQGASVAGLGVLVDLGGNDSYRNGIFGQAAAGPGSAALLMDADGDDYYFIGGMVRDFREPNRSWVSYGQGFGFGHRELGLPGGTALLLDSGGDDLYKAGYFAQGSGTYFGTGALIDLFGNDEYLARRYVQGAGVHFGFGLLLDSSGSDMYDAFGAAQGCGHDLSAGFLVDLAGDDRYDLGWLGQGGARAGGTGVLLDGSGNDRYWAGSKNTQGARELGEPASRASKGLLLDLGGNDFYTGPGKNDSSWGDPGKGCGGRDTNTRTKKGHPD